jgi:DNA-binding transcriptional ArsR family regulator
MLKEAERTLKAAADATRLRILRMLEDGELCVCQVVEVLGLSQSTVSKHLLLLKNAGLIEDEKRGKWVFYRLSLREAGTFPGALAGLLSGALRGEPRVAEDLRKTRLPRVKRLVACCPAPPERIEAPAGKGIRGRKP